MPLSSVGQGNLNRDDLFATEEAERAAGPSSQSETTQELPAYSDSNRRLPRTMAAPRDGYTQTPPSFLAAQYSQDQSQNTTNPPPSSSKSRLSALRPKKSQEQRDHKLRSVVGSNDASESGLQAIRRQLDKGANPAAQSRVHSENAFHKAAKAPNAAPDVVDVLKSALGPEELYNALNARNKDGMKPADIAAGRQAKARSGSRRETTLQRISYRLEPKRPPENPR
jgi:hypothetical protein